MRRTGTELAVEREVEDERGVRRRFRLVGHFDEGSSHSPPSAEEMGRQIATLAQELDAAIAVAGSGIAAARPDRPLAELLEAYHPRQPELVDLLREEGELTPIESDRLRGFLTSQNAPVPSFESAAPPPTDRPLAAAPLAQDRSPTVARPVPELLREYRIESLKQAGAVRARRQISFEEYMALKRHFSAAAPPEPAASPGASTPER